MIATLDYWFCCNQYIKSKSRFQWNVCWFLKRILKKQMASAIKLLGLWRTGSTIRNWHKVKNGLDQMFWQITFQKYSKNLYNYSKTRQILMVSSKRSFPIYIESYRLRIKRKIQQKRAKIEQKTLQILTLFILRPLKPGEVQKVSNG